MATEQELLAVLGDLAVKFSNLEFMVSELLQHLIDPQMHAVGGLLMERMDLHRKIQHARELSRLRYCHRPEIETRIRQTLERVETVRIDRNNFIHGHWVFNRTDLANDSVKCVDSRWSASKDEYHWSRKGERVYRMDELRQAAQDLGALVMEVLHLGNEVAQVPVMTMTKPKPPEEGK